MRCQTCKNIYEYLDTVKIATMDQTRLREGIKKLIDVLRTVEDGPSDTHISADWKPIVQSIDQSNGPLKHLKATLHPVLSQPKPAPGRKEALFWPFKTKDVDKLMIEIERRTRTLQFAFQSIASRPLLHAINVSSAQTDDRLGEVRVIFQDSIQWHDTASYSDPSRSQG